MHKHLIQTSAPSIGRSSKYCSLGTLHHYVLFPYRTPQFVPQKSSISSSTPSKAVIDELHSQFRSQEKEKNRLAHRVHKCVCVCMNDQQPTLDTTMLHQNREPSIKTLTDVKRSLRIGAHPSQLAMCWAPSLVLLLLLQSPTTSVLLRHNATCIATCNVCDSCTFASFVRTLHWGLGFRV